MNNRKGNYDLIENFFPQELRFNLPVNLYLLRKEVKSQNANSRNSKSFVKSKLHCTQNFFVGYFYKEM